MFHVKHVELTRTKPVRGGDRRSAAGKEKKGPLYYYSHSAH